MPKIMQKILETQIYTTAYMYSKEISKTLLFFKI